jgi:hypothetical protein
MRQITIATAGSEIARVTSERDAVLVSAYECLCAYRPQLAGVLMSRFGSPIRAARWMSSHQRNFADGRSPWELLIEGDEDAIWDVLDIR